MQPGGQPAIALGQVANAETTRSAEMWPSPKLRRPGVSMIQPPPGSGSATTDEEVCRPRPVTGLTAPTARPASGISVLTRVDLPTPEWPTRTLIRSASSAAQLRDQARGQRPAGDHDERMPSGA